jgi:nucleotide-binding universal stress UspA family protein
MKTRILLPIDGSKGSEAAVRAVATQFQPQRTEVTLLHVIEPIRMYISAALIPHVVHDSPKIEAGRKRQATELLHRTGQMLRNAGFSVKESLERGDPRECIIKRASDCKTDLIVLGSHGWRGVKRLLMGSVSEAVMRHAKCSVEMVRRNDANHRNK